MDLMDNAARCPQPHRPSNHSSGHITCYERRTSSRATDTDIFTRYRHYFLTSADHRKRDQAASHAGEIFLGPGDGHSVGREGGGNRVCLGNRGRVDVNGLTFHYVEAGQGPLVLCLHGFPDNAYTYSELLPVLAKAGFRGVAPFMRGYAPTEVPSEEAFDSDTLGRDALAVERPALSSPKRSNEYSRRSRAGPGLRRPSKPRPVP